MILNCFLFRFNTRITSLFLLIILGLLLFSCGKKEPVSERVLSENRNRFQKELIDSTILKTIQIPPDSFNGEDWKHACWAMGLAQYRSDSAEAALRTALKRYEGLESELKRSLLETVYGLYPLSFIPEVRKILHDETDPKRFAMAGLYLNRAEFSLETAMEIRDLLIRNFKDQPDNPILEMFRAELHFRQERPPVDDLLSPRFLPGKPVFYTFFRQNRDHPGMTICRLADGSFAMNKKPSDLWFVRHLGRANSGLPGYITNGNTPEGLFSIQGLGTSKNKFIGPTPLVELAIPYEVFPSTFFHGDVEDTVWSRLNYMTIFPRRWQDYLPVYASFYAGKAGRSEIVAHGSTIDPEFHSGYPWYPFTPSLGCLTTLELWDEETGKRKISDQQILIDLIQKEKIREGFWMVIELDKKEIPVEIEDIIRYSKYIRDAVSYRDL
jgi:hypothetical protein